MIRTRYSDVMMQALANQSLLGLALNAIIRGALFTLVLQLLTFASGLPTSTLIQSLLLTLIFALIISSIDLIEKYAVQQRLKNRQ